MINISWYRIRADLAQAVPRESRLLIITIRQVSCHLLEYGWLMFIFLLFFPLKIKFVYILSYVQKREAFKTGLINMKIKYVIQNKTNQILKAIKDMFT